MRLLEQVCKSDLVFAAGADSLNEVEGVRGIVASLLDGVGPCDRQVKVYSKFFKTCLKKMENYISTKIKETGHLKLGNVCFAASKVVFGLPALEGLIVQLDNDVSEGKILTLRDLQVFRTYDWVLTPAMREQATKWIQLALQFDMKCPSKAISDKAQGIHGHAEAASSSSSSSSANQLVSCSVSKKNLPATPASSSDAKSKKGPDTSAVNVMAFFDAKPK
jgi:hypothetical protein